LSKVKKWCLSLLRLELFSRTKLVVRAHFVVCTPIPTPVPTVGIPCDFKTPFVHFVLSWFCDQAQAVLKSRYKWSPHHAPVKPKAFLGLLHYSTCGGAITAEIQKGHIYYRCTKKSRATTWCLQPYIREEDLDKVISDLLKPYSLRSDWADEMLTRVKEEKIQNAQSSRLMAEQKRAEIGKINLRLQTLLDSFLDGIIDRETYIAEKAKGMSQKKSLEEQSSALLKGRADWLEPFQKWILTARNAGEIAIKGSLQEKRVLAQEVFGSNLVLDCKIARGSCVKPWSLLVESTKTGGMVRIAGLEPANRVFSWLPVGSVSMLFIARRLADKS
jgi:Recombinase zinc beta ribbon domain